MIVIVIISIMRMIIIIIIILIIITIINGAAFFPAPCTHPAVEPAPAGFSNTPGLQNKISA